MITRVDGMSVQISSICTTVLGKQKANDFSVKVALDGEQIRTSSFKHQQPVGSCKMEFRPAQSVDSGSTLSIEIMKHRFPRKPKLFSAMKFTTQDARTILGDHTDVIDHLFRNSLAEFRLSFSMTPNATEELIHAGVDVAGGLTGVLSRLREGSKFVETLLAFTVAASELNPIAKAVLASIEQVYKLLLVQDKFEKEICDLVTDMADSLEYLEDVRQFVKSDHLKRALEEAEPLMQSTANLISHYSGNSLGFLI
ncbi:hypothetical protein B0H14DRAFT_3169073 [Mycena olivaceomarginata]|nr:hypothetical protein B0H14DRAFT_3169073 [Mycena olivaceomarginata]